MKKILTVIPVIGLLLLSYKGDAQRPCSDSIYRYFDFWLGEWEAFGKNGQKAGDSRITAILDSCIILEEWTGIAAKNGFRYAGKSFNTYNGNVGQWQQTWVDNAGGSTHYTQGKAEKGKLEFLTGPFPINSDTMAIRRLSFFSLPGDRVRQLGEISKDSGKSWLVEYDLEYRRRSHQ